jgi:condensin complex subunit 2
LIDYFRDMTLLREGDSINFQKASFTLDGCVKVYTSRIDSVEIETRKLLMGLADKHDDEQVEGDKETTTRKRKQDTKTLDDNENLITDQFDLDFQQDPLFQKTAADFDEGGAKGLLLSHLDISSTGKIIFDASDDMPATLVQDEGVEIDMAGLKGYPLKLILEKFGARLASIPSTQICPTFSTFLFNSDQLQDFSIEGEDREDYYLNQDEMSDYEDAPEYDYLNHDFNDDFGDVGQDVNVDLANPQLQQRRMTMVEQRVMKMVANTTVSQDPSMYEYFDSVSNSNWAGPEFWKGRGVRGKRYVLP